MKVSKILTIAFLCITGRGFLFTDILAESFPHDRKSLSAKNSQGFFITIYGGRYTDRHLGEKVLMLKPIYYEDSWLKTIALGKIIYNDSYLYRLELESQLSNHVGEQSHYEFNFLITFRLSYDTAHHSFPLSFAFGNGISYATRVPKIEESSRTNTNASKLLNYLLLEVAADIPRVSDWKIVGRIHHRSGVFGLFNNVRGGSNVMAAGIRHYF